MESLNKTDRPQNGSHSFSNLERLEDLTDASVEINRAGSTLSPPGRRIEVDFFHNNVKDFDLWFLSEGSAVVSHDGQSHKLHPGCCLWLKPELDIVFDVPPDSFSRIYWIHFDLSDRKGRSWLRSKKLNYLPLFQETVHVNFFAAAARQVVQLYNESHTNSGGSLHAAAAILKSLLLQARYELSSATSGEEGSLFKRHRRVASEMLSRINEEPKAYRNASDMARAAGYHSDHFTRIFKTVYKQTPSSALIRARLNKAQDLLLNTELNVGEIAERVGYDSIQYFSLQFKKVIGMNPTEYRNPGSPGRALD